MASLLVTGAAGRLGRQLVAEAGNNVIGAVRSAPSKCAADLEIAELSDGDAVSRLFDRARPKVVIHAAAWADVDGCERDKARCERDHVMATRNVARAARSMGAGFVFVSSDLVFEGNEPPYDEQEPRNPVNAYGRAKRDAEDVARGEHDRAWIVRGTFRSPEQVVRTIGELRDGGVISADANRASTPLSLACFAEEVVSLARSAKKALGGSGGVRHLHGPESVTEFEWMQRVVEALGEDPARVVPAEPLNKSPAPRPVDVSLWTRHAYSTPPLEDHVAALVRAARDG